MQSFSNSKHISEVSFNKNANFFQFLISQCFDGNNDNDNDDDDDNLLHSYGANQMISKISYCAFHSILFYSVFLDGTAKHEVRDVLYTKNQFLKVRSVLWSPIQLASDFNPQFNTENASLLLRVGEEVNTDYSEICFAFNEDVTSRIPDWYKIQILHDPPG